MKLEAIIRTFKQLLKAGATPEKLLVVAANCRREEIERELFTRFNGVIQDGIFKGVRLSPTPHDSVMTPKILGTYEIELVKYIKYITGHAKVFIDIGCADGYYTSGIAASTGVEKVVGVDISSKALAMAINSAEKNQVNSKCIFENDLSNALLHVENGCFIMIDVDGAEIEILNKVSRHIKTNRLRNIHVLIETDFDKSNRSNRLEIAKEITSLGLTITEIIDCNPLCSSRFSPIAREIYPNYLDQMACIMERGYSDQSWIIATTG